MFYDLEINILLKTYYFSQKIKSFSIFFSDKTFLFISSIKIKIKEYLYFGFPYFKMPCLTSYISLFLRLIHYLNKD